MTVQKFLFTPSTLNTGMELLTHAQKRSSVHASASQVELADRIEHSHLRGERHKAETNTLESPTPDSRSEKGHSQLLIWPRGRSLCPLRIRKAVEALHACSCLHTTSAAQNTRLALLTVTFS